MSTHDTDASPSPLRARIAAIRLALRAGVRAADLRGRRAAIEIIRSEAREAIDAAIVAWPREWPLCWCGCDSPAVSIESDSGDPASEECTEYALDAIGEPVCGCDPRVEDAGEWTGGGMHGCGTGWVPRLVVRR